MWHCIAVGWLMCTAALNAIKAHLDLVTSAAPGQWLIGLLNLNISDRNLCSWNLFLNSNSYIENLLPACSNVIESFYDFHRPEPNVSTKLK